MVETLSKTIKDVAETAKDLKGYLPTFFKDRALPERGSENISEPVTRKNSGGFTEYQKDLLKKEYGLSDEEISSYSDWDDFEAKLLNKQELSEEEINEKQLAAIKDGLKRLFLGEELTEQEKGNLCEMMMDQFYIGKGYMPLHPRVTSLNDKVHQGIDGVYQKGNQFVICDAKYDTAQLKDTQDGRQMSSTWIDRRLDECVGKEKADEIRDAEEDGLVSHVIYHYDPNPDAFGNTYSDTFTVDDNGYSNRDKLEVECYNNGERKVLDNGGDNDA